MINILSYFNFEKGSELIENLKNEQNIKNIIELGEIEHTPIDKFATLEEYSDQEIEEDKKTVETTHQKFESYDQNKSKEELEELEKSRKRGEALEITLTHLIEKWFQHENLEVSTQRTTEFDDVVNGTDIIVEFKTPDSIEKIAMTIDASLHVKGIKDKLRKCLFKMTGSDEKLQVKYFQSQFSDQEGNSAHGPLKNVISLVSGLGPENANSLFDDFARYLSLENSDLERAKEKMNELADNPLKKIFMEEIKEQIGFYLAKEDQLRPGLLDELKKIDSIVKDISKEMEDIVCNFKQSDDLVLNEIKKFSGKKR